MPRSFPVTSGHTSYSLLLQSPYPNLRHTARKSTFSWKIQKITYKHHITKYYRSITTRDSRDLSLEKKSRYREFFSRGREFPTWLCRQICGVLCLLSLSLSTLHLELLTTVPAPQAYLHGVCFPYLLGLLIRFLN